MTDSRTSCEWSKAHMAEFAAERLDDETRRALETHLEACNECRELAFHTRNGWEALKAIPAVEFTADELAASRDRAIAAARKIFCPSPGLDKEPVGSELEEVASKIRGMLETLDDFSRRRLLRINSATEDRSYYGLLPERPDRADWRFEVPLRGRDTWTLLVQERRVADLRLHREPDGTIVVDESSGVWQDVLPSGSRWGLRRAAKSSASPPDSSPGACMVDFEPGIDTCTVIVTCSRKDAHRD